jgi:hypothetical protein
VAQAEKIAPMETFDAIAQVRRDDKLRAAAIRVFKSLSVGQVIRSLPKRIRYLWGTANTDDGPVVHTPWSQVQYAVLVLLGLIGFAIRRRQFLRDWPLWIAAGYLSVLHMVFSIEARYTLPARPMLMVYSAAGMCGLVSLVQRKALSETSLDEMAFASANGAAAPRVLGDASSAHRR